MIEMCLKSSIAVPKEYSWQSFSLKENYICCYNILRVLKVATAYLGQLLHGGLQKGALFSETQ